MEALGLPRFHARTLRTAQTAAGTCVVEARIWLTDSNTDLVLTLTDDLRPISLFASDTAKMHFQALRRAGYDGEDLTDPDVLGTLLKGSLRTQAGRRS